MDKRDSKYPNYSAMMEEYMLSARVSTEKMADECGINPTTIYSWRNGSKIARFENEAIVERYFHEKGLDTSLLREAYDKDYKN